LTIFELINSISTSDLGANCSRVVSEVASTRHSLVITRHGRPVARIVPLDDEDSQSLFGFAKGMIAIRGDIVEPIDVEWKAAE
jgi:prevent-host-death family protein